MKPVRFSALHENSSRNGRANGKARRCAPGRAGIRPHLEDPQKRWSKLFSYLTVQGEQQVFLNVLVTDANDHVLFHFGPDGGAIVCCNA